MLNGRRAEDRIVVHRGQVEGQLLIEHHEGGTAANAVSASHTIPVTIAAEQGVVGLALYVALILTALQTLFRGAGRSPPRIAIAACFAALLLHTWVYADFLEDPLTWTLLGLGVAFAVARNGIFNSEDGARRSVAHTAPLATLRG